MYGTRLLQTMWSNVYISAYFLAERGVLYLALDAATYQALFLS
jgi:hypothetical protein